MESLSQKLVEHVATTKKITKPKAVKHINRCLSKISAQENMSYNDIYNIFYSFSGLAHCLAKSCSTEDLFRM